jgi:TetR/AcrR family transcriptional regulator, lmrAB and yxaGH operons repressor
MNPVPKVTNARPTRDRMVDSAVALLRERSSAGVTIDAVLAHSGAPRGSVYHHFPGGRDQLVREAVERSGRYVARLIAEADGHPGDVVRRFVVFWEQVLTATDYLAGCPVVALTVDAGEAERPLVEEVFAGWYRGLLEVFTRNGIEAQRAARLATLTIAATEGAILLCRAQRSAEPLHAVATELRLLLDAVPTS